MNNKQTQQSTAKKCVGVDVIKAKVMYRTHAKKRRSNKRMTDRPATEEMKCNKWTNEYHTLDNELLFRFFSIAANAKRRADQWIYRVIAMCDNLFLFGRPFFFLSSSSLLLHYSCLQPFVVVIFHTVQISFIFFRRLWSLR